MHSRNCERSATDISTSTQPISASKARFTPFRLPFDPAHKGEQLGLVLDRVGHDSAFVWRLKDPAYIRRPIEKNAELVRLRDASSIDGSRVGLRSGFVPWHGGTVNMRSTLARLLTILAVVSMLVIQASGPASADAVMSSGADKSMATMVMGGMPMAMAGMDQCPSSKQAPPDCGKACPWTALCMASPIDAARAPSLAVIMSRLVASQPPVDDPVVAPWSDGPPARPPKA